MWWSGKGCFFLDAVVTVNFVSLWILSPIDQHQLYLSLTLLIKCFISFQLQFNEGTRVSGDVRAYALQVIQPQLNDFIPTCWKQWSGLIVNMANAYLAPLVSAVPLPGFFWYCLFCFVYRKWSLFSHNMLFLLLQMNMSSVTSSVPSGS